MNENNTIIKIVANHTREYNDLDTRYKKLGVKHLVLVENYANLKILNAQLSRENKEWKALLDTAEQMLEKLRKELENR